MTGMPLRIDSYMPPPDPANTLRKYYTQCSAQIPENLDQT